MIGKELNTVLYVDDEPVNLDLFTINFSRYFNVFTALSAKEGLNLIEEHKIDIIITDLKMPEINGLEFIELIKEQTPDKTCILLTAFVDHEVMLKAINEEIVYRYILKPWDKTELKLVLDQACVKTKSNHAPDFF